jgi:hypothetical protein
MEDQKRKFIIIIVLILVLAVFGFLAFFFLNKPLVENPTPANPISQPEQNKETVEIKQLTSFIGELHTIKGERIEVIKDLEVVGFDEELKTDLLSGEIRYFNVSLEEPATIVTKGLSENKTNAKLSDLKIGQDITVEYEEETENAINININQE